MRLRLITLFATVVMGVTGSSLGFVPPAPGCGTIGDCLARVLPGKPVVDPNVIRGVAAIELPGVLFVTNVSVNKVPTTHVVTLQPTFSRYDATGTKTYQGPIVTSGYQLGTVTTASAQYPCVYNRSNQYFYTAKPITTADSNNQYQYRWQFAPYTQYYARVVAGQWTWQEEICATGGADGQNGYRTLYNASVMATKSNDGSTRIGLASDSGSDSTASASLTFQMSAGPITIGASLPTSSGGSLYGQYGKPKYKSWADTWYQTESFAGWRAGCTYANWCGSPNMQNQVHHGLFEFFHGDWNKSFPLDAQFNLYCANPYGVGCG